MARKVMITRTIKMTVATVKILDLETEKVFSQPVSVPHTYKSDKDLLDKVKEVRETDTEKVVSLVSVDVVSTRYGMDEDGFLKNATVLPPLGSKNKKEDDDNEASED